MSNMYDSLHQRTFLLTMSPSDGQDIAELMGFSPPSEEVKEQENIDVMSKWFTLQSIGLLEEINKCADWVSAIIRKQNNLSDSDTHISNALFTSFGVSLLTMLLDSRRIEVRGTMPVVIPSDSIGKLVSLINMFTLSDAEYDEDDWDDEDDENGNWVWEDDVDE